MTYFPLARKYRPQTFADLIGQPHVTTTLTRALEQKRVTQAYLFAGLRGVGKTSAARILAKCLNCTKGPTATPCQQCPSCTQITQGNSLDVIEIDGASNRGIDEIRSLRESVPFAPTTGSFRIYIIDEVHMLTTEAFNALLKTLEEPPAHVKFIFATTAANKVPSTILSRCQRFDFRRLEAQTIVETLRKVALAENVKISDAALYSIARAADGSLRDAEGVLDQLSSFVRGTIEEGDVTALLGVVESEALFALIQAILDRQAPQALTILLQQTEQGKDAPQILAGLLRYFRNLLLMSSTKDASNREELLSRLIDEPVERLQRLAQQASHSTTEELLLLLQLASGAYELVRRSPLAQTLLELVIIKLSTREQWQSLESISQRLEQMAHDPSQPAIRSPVASAAPVSASTPPARRILTPADSAPADPTPTVSTRLPADIPDDLAAIWPAFLEQVGAKKMSLAAYLAEAKPLQRQGGTLTVGLPRFALHQEVLNVAENRKLIAALLSDLCRATITVEYVTLPESLQSTAPASPEAPAANAAIPPVVQDIVNLFNATVDRPRMPRQS